MVLVLLLLLVSACSTMPARRALGPISNAADQGADPFRPDIYRVGELEILVYKDREAMVKNLPELPRLVDGLRFGSQQLKIYGYHDRDSKRIYSVDDIPTLIHEFRHYLEPKWEHPPPQFTDIRAGEPVATQAFPEVREKQIRPNAAPLPKLACLPVCLR